MREGTGVDVISIVMNFPIHDHPYDHWRFTPQAFRSLLKPFTSSFVDFAGESVFLDTVVAVGFKGSTSENAEFKRRFEDWKKYWSNPRKGWKELVKLFISPIPLKTKAKVCARRVI
jgi:hypothetical protein